MKSLFRILPLLIPFGLAFAQQEPKPDVRDYVRSLHDASYTEMASAYDSTVVPELLEMLDSLVEYEHWNRAATMLGAIGDERAVEALISIVEKPLSGTGNLLQAEHDRRRVAMMSLGYLIHRTGSVRALDYLIGSLDPPAWRRRDVRGLGPGWRSYDEYDQQLSTYAIFGLALSGHARAGEALMSLQRSPTPEQRRADLAATLSSWFEVHDLVAERGLAGMYDYYEEQRRLDAERLREEFRRSREAEQGQSEESPEN